MSISYKLKRIFRWGKSVGILGALSFEFQHTIRRPIISFYHKGLGRRIFLRSASSDISVFEHVFVEGEFDIELSAPTLIVDAGANCGFAALYLAHRYPQARVVAVEPNGDNCDLCRRNTEGLNVEVIQSALWSHSTNLKIENPEDEPWAFRCIETGPDDPDGFAATDMHTLLQGAPCDLVKMDIEGAEIEVFRTPNWLDTVTAVVVEIHSEEADTLIRTACDGWRVSRSGEKLLLRR